MKQEQQTTTQTLSATDEIVALIMDRLAAYGLEATLRDFEGMERILSGASWWGEVKGKTNKIFAEYRRQEQMAVHEAELARAKASASTVFQMMPQAQAGISTGELPVDQLNQILGESPQIIHTKN